MKKLPLVSRAFLCPMTNFIDLLLMPNSVSLDFYRETRNFFGGLHVVCWLRLLFIPTLMIMFTLFETFVQEAVLIANQLYQKQNSFNTSQILEEWDKGSFTYDAILFEIYLSVFLLWLSIVTIVRWSLLFVPMQWYGIYSLLRFSYRIFVDQYYRIQNELHIMHNMDKIQRDLRNLRIREYEFPMISVPHEFAPLIRTAAELSVIAFIFFFVYIVERSMLYYGYENILCNLYNRFFENKKSIEKSPEEIEEARPLNS